MKTVHEISKLSGVSVRTLHYYDEIGLLCPAQVTEVGYRLYNESNLARLQDILMFRELEFPLKDIKEILDGPDFDRDKILEQQIELLRLKKERLEQLIAHACDLKTTGGNTMDFTAFDRTKMDNYAKEARKKWGETDAYKEYEQKNKGRSKEDEWNTGKEMMKLFEEFGQMKNENPGSEKVQDQVRKLQEFITKHYYTCTKQILAGLGCMYPAGGSMTENIDNAGGEGTAEFASKAIAIYCAEK